MSQSTPEPNSSAKAIAPRTILAVVALGVFIAADDLTVVATMLRQIVFDLEIPLPDGLDRAAWIVNAYLIAYVVVMPFIGRISDIVGRRAVYVGSMALFLVGSIWIPLSPEAGVWLAARLPESIGWRDTDIVYTLFLTGRVLTALGGGAMVPIAMAVVADIYPENRRASALGFLGTLETSGWVWGPLYGALLIRFLNWEWQFYLNIPVAIIGIATGWWALGNLPRPDRSEKIDWVGAVLLTIGLLTLNVGLLNSGSIQNVSALSELDATGAGRTAPYFIIAIVSIVAFIFYERRLEKEGKQPPLIRLDLFRLPNFSPAVIINFVIGAILIIAMVNVPLVVNVLEFDVGRAALLSGGLLSALTGAMTIMAFVGGKWTERNGYRPVTLTSLIFCTVGFALMGFLWHPAISFGNMAWQLAILGVGFGLATAPIGAAIINAAPDDQRGIASSLVIVFRLIGMSVGLSALTAWGQYRFGILRTQVETPSITDPNFAQALAEALTSITVDVLAETFIISALLAAITLFAAHRLRNN